MELILTKQISNMNKIEFKIGDRTTKGIISRFFLIEDCLMFETDKKDSWSIDQIQKAIPLFQLKDENGKMIDIYEGDIIYSYTDSYFIWKPVAWKNEYGTPLTSYPNNKFFATEKAAQNYIDLNKKIYSKQDILNLVSEKKAKSEFLVAWHILLKMLGICVNLS